MYTIVPLTVIGSKIPDLSQLAQDILPASRIIQVNEGIRGYLFGVLLKENHQNGDADIEDRFMNTGAE